MSEQNYREQSKLGWYRSDGQNPTLEQLTFGALQRIADATELMAKNHAQLISERDRYKRWYETESAGCKRLARSNNALRGYIKRLKGGPK